MRTVTRIFTVNSRAPDRATIAVAAEAIAAGRLVAFPTETVYGLGANALDSHAVDRIFAVKQRPFNDPLIVHVASATQLMRVAHPIPEVARLLAERFWPGALTLVLRRAPGVAPNVSAGMDTVAVRVPAHAVAHALLELSDLPIAAPSANLFSRPSPTTARHVLDDLGGRIDIVLDGGATPIGVESTVLDLTQDRPLLLRPGGVPVEDLRELLPDLLVPALPTVVKENVPAAAPGSLLKHYAPRVPVVLLRGELPQAPAFVRRAVELLRKQGRRPGLLVPDEEVSHYTDLGVAVVTLGPAGDSGALAKVLFARLRELDHLGVDLVLAQDVQGPGLGLAISDRLFRAAEGRVLNVAESPSFLDEFFARCPYPEREMSVPARSAAG